MRLYRITETISDQRRAMGDFALEIVVTQRFLRRARRAAKRGDRVALYRIWYEMCDFAWKRVQARYHLSDSERHTPFIVNYQSRRQAVGRTHPAMSIP